MTITKQYKMNFFDITANSNKVWIGIAYSDGTFETRYGRVRQGSKLAVTSKMMFSESAAIGELERKHAEKLRKGYRDTSVLDNAETIVSNARPADLSKLAIEQISGADDSLTAELIKYLVDVNIHAITHSTSIRYDAANATFSTPLGVLTPSAISEARNLLNEIEKINSQSWSSNSRERFISDYYRLVPADFGVRIPSSSELLNDRAKVKKQLDILDALEASIITPTDSTSEKLFKTKLTKLPHFTENGKAKFREIRALYEKTVNSHHQSHKLKLTRIYEVEIESMKTNFDSMATKIGNVRADLWHGTKASNLLSILKNGLMIPKSTSAHCTGRMFGNGIYTSLQSTKALNYATNYWNNSGAANQRTFMFLTEVALGKMNTAKNRSGNFPKAGTDSTWIEPGTCGVMNHEAIVYDVSQINLKYLCEFGEV